MNNISQFLQGALPWIAMGAMIIYVTVHRTNNKKAKKEDDYSSEGMLFGMCAGIVLQSIIDGINGFGMSLGMLIGLAVGSFIKKK